MRERQERVSAIVLARNEEANLAQCLASLAWADERVVVVDAASRDATERIAFAHAERVLVRCFDDFASQRNAGLERASGEWVFAVDADERSSEEQGLKVRSAIRAATGDLAGFRVPIASVVLGRQFRYSGTQLDRPLRLFRTSAGRWVGEVHETVELSGNVGRLAVPLQHRTIPEMATFLRKIDEYTTLEALSLHSAGEMVTAGDMTVRPVALFLKLYLYRQGFRDGWEGLAFCVMSGVSLFVRNWKRRELARGCAGGRLASERGLRSSRVHGQTGAASAGAGVAGGVR